MNKVKVYEVGKVSALVGVAAGLTYFLGGVTGQELGDFGPLIVVVLTGILKLAQGYLPTRARIGEEGGK